MKSEIVKIKLIDWCADKYLKPLKKEVTALKTRIVQGPSA
jgi:hypothetical protein